ncbi:MAG: (2E,6E)-farnesyl diphosphate synthase, partial [uncultured Gemmatimonadetes bacterium]
DAAHGTAPPFRHPGSHPRTARRRGGRDPAHRRVGLRPGGGGQRVPRQDPREAVPPGAPPPVRRAGGAPVAAGGDAGGGGGAGAPGHAGARRRGGPLGAAPGDAHGERAVEPPGRHHHGRLPVLALHHRDHAPGADRAHPRAGRRGQRHDGGGDAPALVARRAGLRRGGLLPADRQQDGVADVGRVRAGRPHRRARLPRAAPHLWARAGAGLPDRRRPAGLHGRRGADGEAERAGPARAQGDAAADRRAPPLLAGRAGGGGRVLSRSGAERRGDRAGGGAGARARRSGVCARRGHGMRGPRRGGAGRAAGGGGAGRAARQHRPRGGAAPL